MMRYYELTFIAKPDIDEANIGTLIDKVTGYLTADGGKVLKITQWGVRRLMYPIRKFRDGRYVFVLAQLNPDAVLRIEGRLKLTEDVIRYLLIRADDDLDVSKLTAEPAESQPASAEAEPAPIATTTAPAPATVTETAPATPEAPETA